MKKINLGLLGLGTVGSGTVSVLRRNHAEILRRSATHIEVGPIAVRHIHASRTIPLENLQLVSDPEAVVTNPKVDIVVELMGGCHPARELVLKAIDAGKHIVTANKELIAIHGEEIFAAGRRRKVAIAFEAAVAGSIPIIKILRESFAANQISQLSGIVNGTSNYILSEMYQKKVEFADALSDAQRRGYAEQDPEFDVGGVDAAHKLTIMAAIAFGIPLSLENVFVSGISELHTIDIRCARELGYRIKHLAIAKRSAAGLELRVHPALVPPEHQLANIEGAMNAVLVHGNAAGTLLVCGAGAGSEATASAVVADILDLARTMHSPESNRVPYLGFQHDARENIDIVDIAELESVFYLRLLVRDKAGTLASITEILGQSQINVEKFLQKDASNYFSDGVELVIFTQRIKEAYLRTALQAIDGLENVLVPTVSIRVESAS